ncbi:MAG TPA: magnesium transporter [Gammaproteobacteria bacterium]|nr:magnesium transporter [Gammaproteobacteria bacterium]HET7587901.1 magnesium transporter [Gammaproteobacteria bacterium]
MPEAATQNPNDRLQQLREALEGGELQHLRRMLHSLHPAEIAQLLESLPQAERGIVWDIVDTDDHGEILLHLNEQARAQLIEGMDAAALLAAAEGLEMDDLADLIADLPEAVTQRLLYSMDADNRERLQTVMSYPADTAGGLMNTDPVTVRPDVSVDVVLRYLRLRGALPEQTDALFVVDRYQKYLGALPVASLVTFDPDRVVGEIMDTEIRPLDVALSEREVTQRFENLDLMSAPVVDPNGVLVGRITIDDVVDVIRDEAEHNLMTLAGLDEEEDIFAPIFASARRRAIWLGINLVTAFIAARVIGLFEAPLEKVVALAVLMPIVPSMGGIAGTQTLTVMIRAMALGQIDITNAFYMLRKELGVALFNGVLWALIMAAVAIIWFDSWDIGIAIAIAMAINLMFAALAGVTIPLALRRLGVDPALAGSVILTTVTDVVGFAVFLGLGGLILLGHL